MVKWLTSLGDWMEKKTERTRRGMQKRSRTVDIETFVNSSQDMVRKRRNERGYGCP